jgi:hypothetical protein
VDSLSPSINTRRIKFNRPGHILDNSSASLQIGLQRGILTKPQDLESDFVITVNEITSQGAVRLGICVPPVFSIANTNSESSRCPYLNCLCLARQVGTSVVIRKRNEVSEKAALNDLFTNGIYISNSTPTLSSAGHKTGSTLAFHASEEIWKIIRLELTLLRNQQ